VSNNIRTYYAVDERRAFRRRRHQSGIFFAAFCPTAQRYHKLNVRIRFPESRETFETLLNHVVLRNHYKCTRACVLHERTNIETFYYFGIENAHCPVRVVHPDKPVNMVRAATDRYVVYGIFAYARPVHGPIAKIADDFRAIYDPKKNHFSLLFSRAVLNGGGLCRFPPQCPNIFASRSGRSRKLSSRNYARRNVPERTRLSRPVLRSFYRDRVNR